MDDWYVQSRNRKAFKNSLGSFFLVSIILSYSGISSEIIYYLIFTQVDKKYQGDSMTGVLFSPYVGLHCKCLSV